MDIKGKHVIGAKVSDIYILLQDQEVLARIAPGISRIEKVGDDQFRAISDISIGPVRGSFEGELSLTDKVEDKSMTLVLQQKSKIGNAQASILMELSEEAEKTLITYKGKAKVSGRLATMGQRILGGVISTLSKQVFKELDKIVEEKRDNSTNEEVILESPLIVEASPTIKNTTEEISTDKSTPVKKSFIQSIIDKILSIWR